MLGPERELRDAKRRPRGPVAAHVHRRRRLHVARASHEVRVSESELSVIIIPPAPNLRAVREDGARVTLPDRDARRERSRGKSHGEPRIADVLCIVDGLLRPSDVRPDIESEIPYHAEHARTEFEV